VLDGDMVKLDEIGIQPGSSQRVIHADGTP
jgi:hypothetical protein